MTAPKIPLKIAISARDPIGTGGGTVALETARHMACLGHEVVFVSDYMVAPSVPGVHHVSFPLGDKLKNWSPKLTPLKRIRHIAQMVSFSIFASKKLRQLEQEGFVSIDHNIEAFGGDIIVLHNVFNAQASADQRPFMKKIGMYFNPVFWFRIIRERICLKSKKLDTVIGVSKQNCVEAESLLHEKVKRVVINNGVDLVRYSPGHINPDLSRHSVINIPRDAFVVIFIGHEFERKRLDLVIKSIKYCSDNVHLVVVGGRGSSIENYKNIAEIDNVSDRVSFLGTRNDIVAFLQCADCFVLPSEYESWPMVTLEAMACGVPVVMTPVGCAEVVIRDGDTGYVVPWDEQIIAQRIETIRKDATLLQRMRKLARLEAEKYSWESVTEKYITAVKSVIVGRSVEKSAK